MTKLKALNDMGERTDEALSCPECGAFLGDRTVCGVDHPTGWAPRVECAREAARNCTAPNEFGWRGLGLCLAIMGAVILGFSAVVAVFAMLS